MTDSGATIGSAGPTGSPGGTVPRAAREAGPDPAEGSKVDQVKEGAAEAAHEMRGEVADTVSDVAGEASSQLGHVKDEAVAKAGDLLHQTREQVTTQADQGTHQLAESLLAAGRELTGMAERSDQDGPMTTLVRQVGARAIDMGERFQQGGYRALSRDITGFARNSPGMFLLAAAGAGFAVGRVVRNADTKSIAGAVRGDAGGSRDDQRVGSGGPDGSLAPQHVSMPSDLDLRNDGPAGAAFVPASAGSGTGLAGGAAAAGGTESWPGTDMPMGSDSPRDAEPGAGVVGERL
jgi:hypothetical protein